MTTPLEKTIDRIDNADAQIFKIKPLRSVREFRYSDRRRYKQSKMFAVSAIQNAGIYCRFLGPSGVTLAAPKTADTEPVLTWLRYPVSYRRRTRFLQEFADYQGEIVTDQDTHISSFTGNGMKVFLGSYEEAAIYTKCVVSKETCSDLKDNGTPDEKRVALLCWNANKWT